MLVLYRRDYRFPNPYSTCEITIVRKLHHDIYTCVQSGSKRDLESINEHDKIYGHELAIELDKKLSYKSIDIHFLLYDNIREDIIAGKFTEEELEIIIKNNWEDLKKQKLI
jgi:hypothetical protein